MKGEGQDLFAERRKIYGDVKSARFLEALFNGTGMISPSYDPEVGYRYVEAEKALGTDASETRDMLRKFAEAGILSEIFYDMSINCPSCRSVNISSTYTCHFCGSSRISRNALIEHILCGYIDNIRNFRMGDDLICPKCRASLRKADYRSAGSWYECLNCSRRIDAPQPMHTCRKCGEKFNFDEAIYTEVYAYALSELAKNEIRNGNLVYSMAREYLSGKGLNAISPAKVVGESKVEYEFDFMIRRTNGKPVAIDIILFQQPVSREEILKEYAKISDTKEKVEAYVLASPSMSEDAKKLAKKFGIRVLEGNPQKALEKLAASLAAKLHHK
ncbi:MAG: hypothetical protein RMJ07_05695 [Nitrososphaerota archaeon]|nr:hypothetical protein [Candidatus Bathyarchaeota archaeon]MDW8049153.1 hypothetical protein [Nitrososphaerota archaeon]